MSLSGPVKAVAMLVAVCGLAGAAAGQQYRGEGGTLLDRNNQIGSGGKNVKTRNVRDQIWFNNQVITGNAPAGRSFRGYVGYTAPAQFRGATGTDQQFSFVRDSTSSATVATGVRASDALRYQFDITTGQSAPAYMASGFITRRGADAATASISTSTDSALRSTADYMTARALRPTLVGSRRDAQGVEYTATASSLLGLTWMRVNPVNPAAPLPGADTMLPPTPGLTPPAGNEPIRSVTPGAPPRPPEPTGMVPTGLEARGLAYRSNWDQARTGVDTGASNAAARGVDTSVDSSAASTRSAAHARMMDSLRGSFRPASGAPAIPGATPTGAKAGDGTPGGAGGPGGVPGAETESKNVMDIELERIRRVLRGESPMEKPKPRQPGELITPAPGDPKKGETGKDDEQVSPEVMRTLKTLGEKSLDSLTPSAAAQSDPEIYRLHMDAGQQFLSEGRYFDAEDRFTRAISAMPDDPLAKAGRVHAQLGAGLYLSASTNLRKMIEANPEVVGLRFDRKLAPLPDRTKSVAEQLRHEIDQGSTGLGLESSLLLTYLGRITGDQAMTDEGLADMKARQPEGNASEAALYQLLSGVWGSGAAPSNPPIPAPSTPATAPAPTPPTAPAAPAAKPEK